MGLAAILSVTDRGVRDRSERLLREAIELAGRIDDRPGQTLARTYLGHLVLIRGDVEEALRLQSEALKAGEPGLLRAHCLYGFSQAATASGDFGGATTSLEEALDIARRNSGELIIPQLLAPLAPLVAVAGEDRRAEALAEEAVEAAASLRLPAIFVMALTRASETRILTRDFARARTTLRQLLILLRELGGERFVADALEMAALLADEEGRSAATLLLLATCRVMREADGEPLGGTRTVSSLVRECDERVHESLAPAESADKGAHGRQMTSAEAIEYALAQLVSGVDT
jgi:tetratricopeptide (TPR) repeat protein